MSNLLGSIASSPISKQSQHHGLTGGRIMREEKYAMQMQLIKQEFKQFFFHHDYPGVCHALVCLENQQLPYQNHDNPEENFQNYNLHKGQLKQPGNYSKRIATMFNQQLQIHKDLKSSPQPGQPKQLESVFSPHEQEVKEELKVEEVKVEEVDHYQTFDRNTILDLPVKSSTKPEVCAVNQKLHLIEINQNKEEANTDKVIYKEDLKSQDDLSSDADSRDEHPMQIDKNDSDYQAETDHIEFQHVQNLEKIPAEEEAPSSICVSIWDVSSRKPVLLNEVKINGFNGIDLRFSRCGKNFVLTYKEGTCKNDQKFKIAIIDSTTLRVRAIFDANNLLKEQTQRFADLAWNSEYLIFFDQISKQVFFYKITGQLDNDEEQKLKKPIIFNLYETCKASLGVLDFKNYMINENQNLSIYTVCVEEGGDESRQQMFSQNILKIEQHDIEGKRISEEKLLKREHKVRNVQKMQHVAANRNFTEIFLVGDDKKKSKFLFNLKRSEYCETLTNLGTMVETMKNSWMYNELMLSFVNSNGTRMLVNLSKKRMVKSQFQQNERRKDVMYSDEFDQFIEAIFNEADTLNICFYGDDIDQQDNYVSTVGKCFPYVIVFPYVFASNAKKSIIIRDIQRPFEQYEFNLNPTETFICFVKVDDNHIFDSLENRGKKKSLVKLGFMTFLKETKKYSIQSIILEPYGREFKVQHWISDMSISSKKMPSGEILNAEIFSARQSGNFQSMLILQLKDRIYVKSLLKNRSFSEIAGLAPLRMVSHPTNNPKNKLHKYKIKTETEYFYLVHKKQGTEIKICSFKDASCSSKPFSTCFLDQTGKALCFDIRSTYDERLIFTLNDRMTVRVFKVVSEEGQKSQLQYLYNLETDTYEKEMLQKNRDTLFKPFHRCHMTQQFTLHIDNWYFKFSRHAYELGIQEEKHFLTHSFCEEESNINLLRGPFQIEKNLDTLGYFYQVTSGKNQGYYCIIRPSSDSKIRLLINQTCSFVTFIPGKENEDSPILACVNGTFHLFSPEGRRIQKIVFEVNGKEWDRAIKVLYCTDFCDFFIFEGIPYLYHFDTKKLKFTQKQKVVPNVDYYRPEDSLMTDPSIMQLSNVQKSVVQARQTNLPELLDPIQVKQVSKTQVQRPQKPTHDFLKEIENRTLEEITEVSISRIDVSQIPDMQSIIGEVKIDSNGNVWNLFFNRNGDKSELWLFISFYDTDEINQTKVDIALIPHPTFYFCMLQDYFIVGLQNSIQTKIFYAEKKKLIDERPKSITLYDVSTTKSCQQLAIGDEWFLEGIYKDKTTRKTVEQQEQEAVEKEEGEEPELKIWNRALFRLIKKTQSGKLISSAFLTWDFDSGKEHDMYEIEDQKDNRVVMLKGLNAEANFCAQAGKFPYFCSLTNGFPIKCFNFEKFAENFQYFEKALPQKQDQMLCRMDRSVIISSSITSAIRKSLEIYKRIPEGKRYKYPLPQSFRFFKTANGDNIFHILVEDHRMLKRFCKNFEKYIASFDDKQIKEFLRETYLLMLIENNQQDSPFRIALLNKRNPNTCEIMLKALINLNKYLLTQHMFRNREEFQMLMDMHLPSMHPFLDQCYFQPLSIQAVQVRVWKSSQDRKILRIKSSLLSQSFLDEVLGHKIMSKLDEDMYVLKKKTFQQSKTAQIVDEVDDRATFNLNGLRVIPTVIQNVLEDQEEESKEKKIEKKRVVIKIVEFDWMFDDKMADFCLQMLIDQEDSAIFMQDTIRICIEFLWKNYFWEIFRRNFLYFVAYLIVFLVVSMFLFDKNSHRETIEIVIAYIIEFLLIIASFQGLYIEFMQMKDMKMKYFRPPQGIWNSIDILSNIFVLAFCINDIIYVSKYSLGRQLAAIALFFLWLKFFYFLRIFEPTEKFIRMISAILYDSQTFLLIYVIANLIFANVFYMLDGASRLHKHASFERATGDGFWETALYTFLTGLGEFDTDSYNKHDSMYELYIFFLLCIFMIQIVLLNLLIAIMGDSFARIQELADQDHLREVAKLIVENRAYIKKDMFKDVKYIMVAQLESSIGLQSSTLKSKISRIKNLINVKFQQLSQNQRVMGEKISESQFSAQSKMASQIDQMQRQIKDIETNISQGKQNQVKYSFQNLLLNQVAMTQHKGDKSDLDNSGMTQSAPNQRGGFPLLGFSKSSK